jgi:hypothetical protein
MDVNTIPRRSFYLKKMDYLQAYLSLDQGHLLDEG